MDLVKMSAKGQLVVPQELREEADFQEGDRFVPVLQPEGVLFKKINLSNEFERITRETQEQFRKKKITQQDVQKAVRWVRKSS